MRSRVVFTTFLNVPVHLRFILSQQMGRLRKGSIGIPKAKKKKVEVVDQSKKAAEEISSAEEPLPESPSKPHQAHGTAAGEAAPHRLLTSRSIFFSRMH